MRTISASIALALALVTAACGGDDDGGESYDTLREAVTAVVQTGCEHFDECELLGEATVEQCVNAGINATCGTEGVDCDGPVPADVTAAEINDCIAAVDSASCETTELPAACSAVVGS